VVWAILSYSWQAAFVITADSGSSGGVVVAVLSVTRKTSALSEPERILITSGQESHLRGDGTGRRSARSCGSAILGHCPAPFPGRPGVGHLTFWLPLYLNTVRHFDLKQIALFA